VLIESKQAASNAVTRDQPLGGVLNREVIDDEAIQDSGGLGLGDSVFCAGGRYASRGSSVVVSRGFQAGGL
jgi:hypothetical protein